MSALERIPESNIHSVDTEQEHALSVAANDNEAHGVRPEKTNVEHLLNLHRKNETLLVHKGLSARGQIETLAAGKRPEDIAELREKLSEVIREAQIALDKLAATTALTTTLAELAEQKEGEAPPLTSEDIANNPVLAEELLEGVVEVGERAPDTDLMQHSLAAEARETLKELKPEGVNKTKLALTVAERVLKIILDAHTFGLGGAVYDTLKDIAVQFKTRRQYAHAA